MIACILMASGFSRRFGSDKLFYEIADKPMYRYALENLISLQKDTIGGEKVKAVVVARHRQILEEARADGLDAALNPEAEEGIAASIRCGVRHFPDAEHYVFLVADQPALAGETIRSFLTAVLASGKPLGTVTARGIPGNPAYFAGAFREELLSLTGDRGGRKILNAHPGQVFYFEVDLSELEDLDFPVYTPQKV